MGNSVNPCTQDPDAQVGSDAWITEMRDYLKDNILYRWKSEDTPYFRDSTYKGLILSVVARRSLARRVARL
jgi:hypothetical protein